MTNAPADQFSAFLQVYCEKIAQNGEDSFAFMHDTNGSMLAVFDGCGGLGSRRYATLNNKTGAYMASRLVARLVREHFFSVSQHAGLGLLTQSDADALTEAIRIGLQEVRDRHLVLEHSAISGSMSRALPTTVAIAVVDASNRGTIHACFLSAGDSRAYLLSQQGLMQCTVDDTAGNLDAFQNITSDARLKNFANADIPFHLRLCKISWQVPCMVMVATDGIFHYFRSPMEFEHCLIETLRQSDSVEEWESRIDKAVDKVAADDYSLLLCAYGYESFKEMKCQYLARFHLLCDEYIAPLRKVGPKDTETRGRLWAKYRIGYEGIIKNG